MEVILHELVDGKMNIRKLILWAFIVLFLVLGASAAIAIVRALWAVSDFVVANPSCLTI